MEEMPRKRHRESEGSSANIHCPLQEHHFPSTACAHPPGSSPDPWVRVFKRIHYVAVCECACVLNCFTHVRLFATLWTVSHQAPLSMGFSMQESWSELACPPPGDLPYLGIEPEALVSSIGRQLLYHQRHLGSNYVGIIE